MATVKDALKQRESMNSKLMVASGKAMREFEIDARERGARSSFERNRIDPRRVTESTRQLSASKRGTDFRKVVRRINFSPPQAFDENGVH
jgi:hypothetical protein